MRADYAHDSDLRDRPAVGNPRRFTMARISILVRSLLSISIIAGTVAPLPSAQAQVGVVANVPFDFSTKDQRWTAGTYRVELISSHYLLLRNTNSGKSQFMLAFPARANAIPSRASLVFHRYGGHYYLAEVQIVGTSEYRNLMQSRDERQEILTSKTPLSTNVEVAFTTPIQ
jgi:hypothetical protein